MMTLEDILKSVQKTNPQMTMRQLIYELDRCEYTAKSLMFSVCAIDRNKKLC